MDTQNTPVHIKLWHREFWMLAFANLLLMMSIYSLVSIMPPFLLGHGFSGMQVGCVMGIYGLGLITLGGFCAYFVQRYRRNHVCQLAILGMVFCMALLYYLEFVQGIKMEFWMMLIVRFFLGVEMGIAEIVLGSTLVVDICESFQRTSANHIVSWFGRLALALGPLAALFTYSFVGYSYAFAFSGASALLAWLLISMVKFPFKAPAENIKVFSCDRFFLPQGFPLFVNLLLITTTVGIVFSQAHDWSFFAMLLAGLVLALVAERFAFADANLKSEVITGLIMMVAAFLMLFTGQQMAVSVLSPALIGFSMGLIGSRFLLFYVKLANHCQRGTSQSSFFLAWEMGVSLGLLLGFGVLPAAQHIHFCLLLLVVSFLLYNFFVHPWYMKHKNR